MQTARRSAVLEEMGRNFEPWVRRMLVDDKYVGWIIRARDRAVASAGFLLLDWAPHYLDPAGEQRGYVLNVFVEPEYRKARTGAGADERMHG